MELYKIGEITISQLQDVFAEWQTEIAEWQYANFELLRLKLIGV